jgi:PAS domain S-box-containing protein
MQGDTTDRFLEVCPDSAAVLDVETGRIAGANGQWARLCGRPRDALVGTTFRELSPDGWRPDVSVAGVVEGSRDGPATFEWRVERPDGTVVDLRCSVSPLAGYGEGRAAVTAREAPPDAERRSGDGESLGRYRQLIENVPVGVYRNTPGVAGEFRAVNPAMVEMFDAESEAELLETPVAELYRRPRQRERLSHKLDTEGRVEEEEIRLETVTGDPFWGAVTAFRHEDDGDVYYDGIVQDVTDRRETERQLRLREQRFRRLFEEHNAAMLLIDPESGAIERANDAATEFYGYDESELTSMAIEDINRLSDEAVDRRRRAAARGETNRFVFPHELADGEVRRVEVDSTPIHTGEKRLLFSIVHDVTERERTRKRLEDQNEQLEVLNRVVRHDIRNDMTVVINYAELLADYVDPAGEDHLETVIEHGRHAIELTRTVRELMEAMLDGDDAGSGPVDLSAVLEAEIEDAEGRASDARFEVQRPLPDVRVSANEMLSSVFRNLLANAVDHNDAVTPEVAVAAETREDSVVVRVADNGPGVPDGRKEEIFGKGEHGMDSSGTGLGLYLVATIVEEFGGDVRVTDGDDPDGAVFQVELPRAE